jgi:GTP cyclohydrolase FolE2
MILPKKIDEAEMTEEEKTNKRFVEGMLKNMQKKQYI